MKELLIVMLIFIILFFIIFNIAPFIQADEFGHYIVPICRNYIYGEETPTAIILRAEKKFDIRKEKCNPWLMWWENATGLQLVKMKPPETYYTYKDDHIEHLWKQAGYGEDIIPCEIHIIKISEVKNED